MGRNINKLNTDGCNLFYLKLTGLKEDETPIFMVQKKDINGKFVSEPPTTNIFGDLKKIEWSEYKYDNDKKTGLSCSIHLCDKKVKEWYILQMGFSFTMRSIVNSLLFLEDLKQLENVFIEVYKSKKTGSNGSIVKLGSPTGEPLAWKHDYKKVLSDKIEKITKKDGSVINDYGDLDNFFKEEIDRFNEYCQNYWGSIAPIDDVTELPGGMGVIDTDIQKKVDNFNNNKTAEEEIDESDLPF